MRPCREGGEGRGDDHHVCAQCIFLSNQRTVAVLPPLSALGLPGERAP